MLDSALLGERKQAADGVDVELLVQVVDGGWPLHALVDTRCEDEGVAASEVGAHLVVGHLKIVAKLNLHLGRKRCPFGHRRQRESRHFVAAGDELADRLASQKSRTANHEHLHGAPSFVAPGQSVRAWQQTRGGARSILSLLFSL